MAPSQRKTPGSKGQATGLVPIRCGTWHDLIFINLSSDAPAFEAYIDPVERLCAGYDLSAVRFGMEQVDAVAANWKLAVENFAENYHEPWVHPSLTADRVDPRTNEKLYRDISEGCYFGFGYTGPTWRGDVYGRLPLIPGQTPDKRTAFTVAVFPNTWLVLKESLLLTGILTPTAPGRTQVRWILQFVGDAAADHEIAEAQQVVADLWRTTMRQDLEITEVQQAGRASPAANDVKFSPFWEEFPHLFQNMVLDALS